ncbi:MAG: hypothetical protein LC732_04725, partial [Acidobacteria bacterium]|nr:hypothetical protein [Acidobacteriota bacterium]
MNGRETNAEEKILCHSGGGSFPPLHDSKPNATSRNERTSKAKSLCVRAAILVTLLLGCGAQGEVDSWAPSWSIENV